MLYFIFSQSREKMDRHSIVVGNDQQQRAALIISLFGTQQKHHSSSVRQFPNHFETGPKPSNIALIHPLISHSLHPPRQSPLEPAHRPLCIAHIPSSPKDTMYSCHRRGNHRKLKRTPCAGEIRRWRSSSSGKYQWGELADDDGANDLGLLPPPVVVGPDASGLRRMIDRVLLRRRGATRSRSPPPPAPAALVDQVSATPARFSPRSPPKSPPRPPTSPR